jgi:hypothetical protein
MALRRDRPLLVSPTVAAQNTIQDLSVGAEVIACVGSMFDIDITPIAGRSLALGLEDNLICYICVAIEDEDKVGGGVKAMVNEELKVLPCEIRFGVCENNESPMV